MIGIYHSRDPDGWTSGAIIKKVYPDAKMIGYDYGDRFPWNEIPEGEDIIMADVSLSRQDMMRLGMWANGKLLWIDHHKSAIEEMEGIDSNVMTMVLNTVISACEGCWEYMIPEPVPAAVTLLGMYDSFRHKGTDTEQDVLFFQYYARSIASDVEQASVFLEEDFDVDYGINSGKFIYSYLCMEARQKYAIRHNVEFTYDAGGQNEARTVVFAMVNTERFNPVNFGIDYHDDGYDGAGCFWYVKGKGWVFSLYNDNGAVDCSIICKKLGGGGHKGAAGFVADHIELYL